jgi:hypothetical protein
MFTLRSDGSSARCHPPGRRPVWRFQLQAPSMTSARLGRRAERAFSAARAAACKTKSIAGCPGAKLEEHCSKGSPGSAHDADLCRYRPEYVALEGQSHGRAADKRPKGPTAVYGDQALTCTSW